jgi:hypothetical protein
MKIYTSVGEVDEELLEIRQGVEHDGRATVEWTEYYLRSTNEQVRRDVHVNLVGLATQAVQGGVS